MKKGLNREAKIGLVTIVAMFFLYYGLNHLKGIDIFKSTNNYYVKFQNVTELQRSAPVYVDGFKVGLVNEIIYNYETHDGILVEINLEKSMRIEKGTYVKMTSGFTTGASLNLVLNKHVSDYFSPGDTLEGRTTVGLMDKVSEDLLPQVENMLPKLDSILYGIQTLVNSPALSRSLDNVERTTANLARTTAQLNRMVGNDVPSIMSNFKTISSDFAVVSDQLKKVDIESTMRTVDSALKNVDRMTNQMNSNDNSLGLLLNDRQLYDNLNATSVNAASLLQDLKENPKRYVQFSIWGK